MKKRIHTRNGFKVKDKHQKSFLLSRFYTETPIYFLQPNIQQMGCKPFVRGNRPYLFGSYNSSTP